MWSCPTVPSRYEDIDLVVVRENTEGLYAGLEHEVVPGVVESLKIITEKASTRIARFAFEYARTHGRKRVTAVHKANIMKMSDGLFLRCFRKVGEEYPDIESDERIVDNACMQLVMDPSSSTSCCWRTCTATSSRISCAGLVGGLASCPARTSATEIGVFEAVHGSAPDIAGKGIANPTALLQSAVLMLRHIGEGAMADRIMTARRRDAGRGHGPDARPRRHGDTTSSPTICRRWSALRSEALERCLIECV